MHLIPSFTLEGFYLGPVYVYTWGLAVAIGVLAAAWPADKKVGSRQSAVGSLITENQFWKLVILLVISVFLGARISYVLETWNYYLADPTAFLRLWEGGFSFFGGVVGGLLTGWLWSKKNKIDFLYLGWLFTPAWLFGLFFGRVGCFLIHDHLGKATDLPWGVLVSGVYRYEPASYEALWALLIGVGLYYWESKSRQSSVVSLPAGEAGRQFLFPFSLLLYSVGRFFLDFLRADDPLYFGLTVAQWACIGIFIWSMYLIKKKARGSH